MKFRLTLFLVFQVVAWTAYFNWESRVIDPDAGDIAEKVIQVEEMSANQFASISTRKELYKIILRNDGFFTKVNDDKSFIIKGFLMIFVTWIMSNKLVISV